MESHLRLKVTIEIIKWLAKQTYAFRGHNESNTLSNRSNFIKIIKLFELLGIYIVNVILDYVSITTKYTSPMI